jgi:hypothetical protein
VKTPDLRNLPQNARSLHAWLAGPTHRPTVNTSHKEYDHFEKTAVPLADTYPHKPAKDFGPADWWSGSE